MAEEALGAVASEIPVTPAADAAPSPDPTAGQGVETPEGDKPVVRERVKFDDEQQKEVDRIVAKTRAQESRRLERVARAEAEAAHYRRLHEESQRPATQAQPADGRPQWSQFQGKENDVELFVEALADWKIDQKTKTTQNETRAQQERRSYVERARAAQENFKAAAEKYPDFQEVISAEGLPFYEGSAILAYIEKSKAGGEVAYHLGNNRDEVARIENLHPIDQVIALHALEAKLTAPPRPTKTPAPIVPNGGNSAGSKSIGDLIGASQEDFEKHRKARLARK